MTEQTQIAFKERAGAGEASSNGEDTIDVREKGRNAAGEIIGSDRRLYLQFYAFGDCINSAPLIEALQAAQLSAVLYEDVNDPRGVGLLIFSESPEYFVTTVRHLLLQPPFVNLTPKSEYTMLGRTYTIGYEQDLDEVLVLRPRRRVCDPSLKWALWYPLRRAGSFEQLTQQEQNTILMEHGGIGRAYGRSGLAYDIRLACHGLDKNDSDFITGLVGPELHPLSHVVQRMRKTKQTSQHLERLGPFFVGHVLWQATLD